MRKIKSTFLAMTAALLLPMTANAVPITYDIDIVIGTGTVQGTITTNGVLGAVSADDILAFEISVNDGIDTFLLNNTIGLAQLGGDTSSTLIASLTSLSFNFDGADGWFALENISDGVSSYRFVGWFQESTWMTIRHQNIANGHDDLQIAAWNQQGMYEIGTVASVPEPGTFALFGLGLFGLAASRKKKV